MLPCHADDISWTIPAEEILASSGTFFSDNISEADDTRIPQLSVREPVVPVKRRPFKSRPGFKYIGVERLSKRLPHEGNTAEAIARSKRLEREILDLREAYARKIASTELECEAKLDAKDREMKDWYEQKKYDIASLKVAASAMYAMFQARSRRHLDQIEANRIEAESMIAAFKAELENTRQENSKAMAELQDNFDRTVERYERQVATLLEEKQGAEDHIRSLGEQLSNCQNTIAKLNETNDSNRIDIEQLKKKVAEIQKAEELVKKQARIDGLEAELKKTREFLEHKAKKEKDLLSSELMGYVQFIVHILPDKLEGKLEEKQGATFFSNAAKATLQRLQDDSKRQTVRKWTSLPNIPKEKFNSRATCVSHMSHKRQTCLGSNDCSQ